MIIDSIYSIVDARIDEIEASGKRASVIVLAESLFRQMQQEMMYSDMSQKFGKVRSPFDLQVHRGVKVICSQVVESVEIY